jgi:hypothetical protein
MDRANNDQEMGRGNQLLPLLSDFKKTGSHRQKLMPVLLGRASHGFTFMFPREGLSLFWKGLHALA